MKPSGAPGASAPPGSSRTQNIKNGAVALKKSYSAALFWEIGSDGYSFLDRVLVLKVLIHQVAGLLPLPDAVHRLHGHHHAGGQHGYLYNQGDNSA